jgi:hypothetical protein
VSDLIRLTLYLLLVAEVAVEAAGLAEVVVPVVF